MHSMAFCVPPIRRYHPRRIILCSVSTPVRKRCRARMQRRHRHLLLPVLARQWQRQQRLRSRCRIRRRKRIGPLGVPAIAGAVAHAGDQRRQHYAGEIRAGHRTAEHAVRLHDQPGRCGTAASGTTLTVADTLPAGVIANSVSPAAGVSSINCGPLPSAAGATLSCTVTLTAPLPASAANGAASFTITLPQPRPVRSLTTPRWIPPVRPTATTRLGLYARGELRERDRHRASAADHREGVRLATMPLGATTSLTFTITNPNPANPLNGVAFTDNLPAGMAVAAVPNANNTCGGTFAPSAGATTLTLSGVMLASGGTARSESM